MINFVDFLEKKQHIKHLVFTTLFFGLALFSKETAAVLPIFFLAYFWIKSDKKILLKHWALAGSLAIIGVLWLWLRDRATMKMDVANNFSEILNNFQSIPTVFSLVFLPVDFSPIAQFTFFKTILGSLILVGIIVLIIKSNHKFQKWLTLFWFVLFLLPTLITVMMDVGGGRYMAHRFLLPAIGVFWLLAIFADDINHKSSLITEPASSTKLNHKLTTGFAISLIVIFSVLSFFSSKNFANSETFYSSILRNDPQSTFAFTNRGLSRAKYGYFIGAESDFRQALKIDSTAYNALLNLGIIESMNGNYDEGIALFTRAIQKDSTNFQAFLNRGVTKKYLGDYAGALQDFETVIAIKPNNISAINNRAFVLSQMNN
jgi:Flp pilus assembly protein TadD